VQIIRGIVYCNLEAAEYVVFDGSIRDIVKIYMEGKMGTVTEALKEDLSVLEGKAIGALNRASEDLVAWVDLVRDPEKPWAFRWAEKSVRGANVGACTYILEAAIRCGVLDQILTHEQKRQGSDWIHSLEVGENVFTDPALVDRKPPKWKDEQENWPPDGAHREAINQYARSPLRAYEGLALDTLGGPPPPSWPQKGDADVLDWIKKVEPNWSWIGRIIHRLISWYGEGAITKELLLECMDYAHSRQDPETGFWNNSIQNTFKLLIPVHDPAELPVPRADKIIDSVLRVMENPTYDDDLFPCEEFDAFYDLAIAWTSASGYREQDIKKLAAYRINYILESHRQADRGLSSYLDRCIPTWLDWDMAPAVPQGDAFAWGIYSYGINICVDILGIADQVSWTGLWRQRDQYHTSAFVEVGKELAK
jgi:hypothetical protein